MKAARILLVDDDRNFRRVTAANLEKGGYQVDTATDAEDALRANTWGLLGHLLAAPPTDESLVLLGRINDDADGSADLLAAAWQMLRQAAGRAKPVELEDEFHDLFTGMGRGELMPYGSWYLTGFLMEQPLAQLRGDLRALGIERQPGVHEPEDHAAALCDTMALLITGDEPVPVDLQSQFFARHMEPWMGRFFRDLQQATSARFYRAVGQLGERFMDVETRAFAMSIPAAGTSSPRTAAFAACATKA